MNNQSATMNIPLRKWLPILIALVISSHPLNIFAGPSTQPSDGPLAPDGIVVPSPSARGILLFDDDDDDKPANQAAGSTTQSSGRYFFDLLDHRSSYGKGFFPGSFLGPDFDAEKQVEVDYSHSEKPGQQNNEADGEFVWNVIGQLSIAGEFGWSSAQQTITPGGFGDDGEGGTGVDSVNFAAYHPIFQYVSDDDVLDYSLVARVDLGFPTRTPASGNDLQVTPYLGQLLRIGDHVGIQTWTGAQITIAPGQTQEFIYGASMGYLIKHNQWPVPLMNDVTPMIEFDGQSAFSKSSDDPLFGVVGFTVGFKAVGHVEPYFAVGYQFPLDQAGRDELHWGVITQVGIEF